MRSELGVDAVVLDAEAEAYTAVVVVGLLLRGVHVVLVLKAHVEGWLLLSESSSID
jgi:hypothetical protein